VLLEVDEKLAVIPRIAYKVRLLQTAGDAAKSELRSAAKLSRRDVKRSAEGTDLARVLTIVQTAMKRDLATLELAATEIARPAIVFYALDAPLADAVTAEVYDELAQEASITWVVPGPSADLISPAFAEGDDARIIVDHQTVADEVITILLRGMREVRDRYAAVSARTGPSRPDPGISAPGQADPLVSPTDQPEQRQRPSQHG
jgi:hypothetical protein